ncbi:MAG: hypothetical protein AAF203_00820 [Pseudomonadota bacterium]
MNSWLKIYWAVMLSILMGLPHTVAHSKSTSSMSPATKKNQPGSRGPTSKEELKELIQERMNSCNLEDVPGTGHQAVATRMGVTATGIPEDLSEEYLAANLAPTITQTVNIKDPLSYEAYTHFHQYHFDLAIQARTNAIVKISKLLLRAWDGEDIQFEKLKKKVKRQVLRTLCHGHCSSRTIRDLRETINEYIDHFERLPSRDRGLDSLMDDVNTSYRGLNSILKHQEAPIEMRYMDQVVHMSHLVTEDFGPILLMTETAKVAGDPIAEKDILCDGKYQFRGQPCRFAYYYNPKVTKRTVKRAVDEFLQRQLSFWREEPAPGPKLSPEAWIEKNPSERKAIYKKRDQQIAQIYALAPGVVAQVHAGDPQYESHLCQYTLLSTHEQARMIGNSR